MRSDPQKSRVQCDGSAQGAAVIASSPAVTWTSGSPSCRRVQASSIAASKEAGPMVIVVEAASRLDRMDQ